MAGDKLISLALCSLAVIKSIQPHWLYFDQYVYTKYSNITSDELQRDIIPVRDYSCLILTLFVIAGTDYVKYKPIIILQAFFSVIMCALLIWDQQVVPLIVSQVFRGFILSTDVAFYSYIFAIVSSEKYKLNTCLTQVCVLFGQFLGNLLAILLVVLQITSNLDTINYISFSFSIASLIVTFLLPHVQPRIPTQREIIERELRIPSGLSGSETLQKSPWEEDGRSSTQSVSEVQGVIESYAHVNDPAFTAYARSNMFSDIDTSSIGFYGDGNSDQFESSLRSESIGEGSITSVRGDHSNQPEGEVTPSLSTLAEKFSKFLKDIKKVYSEIPVIYWSIWMILSGLGYYIMQDKFIRLLDEATPDRLNQLSYDAGSMTLAILLATIPILIYGVMKKTLYVYTEPIVFILLVLQTTLMLILANANNIWLIYTVYIFIIIIYQLGFTIAIFLIGNVLQARRYGFIFGCNLLFTIIIKLLLMVILDNTTLNVSTQINATGGILGVFGLCFLCKILYNIIKLYQQNGQCCGNYSNPQDRDLLVTST